MGALAQFSGLARTGIGRTYKAAGGVMGITWGWSEYAGAREMGLSVPGSAARAGGVIALWHMFPWLMNIHLAGQAGYHAGKWAYEKYMEQGRWMAGLAVPGLGTTFNDSEGAYTSRARAMQLMQRSQLNLMQTRGSEAVLMHR